MNYSPSFSTTTPGFVSGNLTSKSSTPFLLVPNRPQSSSSKKSSRSGPSFPLSGFKSSAQPSSSKVSAPVAGSSTAPAQTFKPPAHKHAHHLHSIPPREKTTRSLILDHMLWSLGRARFAQVRAELGMGGWHGAKKELLGAPPSAGDAISEQESEGESVEAVSFGLLVSERKKKSGFDDLRRMDRADPDIAQSFRSRAEGLEKVVSGMLNQHPDPQPMSTIILSTSPDPPKPPRLPNGVRLRLMLTSLVNDVFSRSEDDDEGVHSYEKQYRRGDETPRTAAMLSPPPDSPMSIASIVTSPHTSASNGDVTMRSASPPGTPTASKTAHLLPSTTSHPAPKQPLPPSLTALSQISSFTPLPSLPLSPTRKPINEKGSGPPQLPVLPSVSSFDIPPQFDFSLSRSSDPRDWPIRTVQSSPQQPPFALKSQFASTSSLSLPDKITPRTVKATGRSKELFEAGLQSSSHPPEDDVLPSPLISRSPHWSASTSSIAGTSMYTHFSNASTRSISTMATTVSNDTYRNHHDFSATAKRCPRHLTTSCRCSHADPACSFVSEIGAGLSQTGPPLRRKPYIYVPVRSASTGVVKARKRKIRRSRMTDLLPRFLRLSALVAQELGREAAFGDDSDSEYDGGASSSSSYGVARPSTEWFALLAGLVTRAVLEGYLMRGWRGAEGVEILCGLGGGLKEAVDAAAPEIWEDNGYDDDDEDIDDDGWGYDSEDEVDEDSSNYEPDGLPGLVEAGKILFPFGSGGNVSGDRGRQEWEEWEREMGERAYEFLNVPAFHSSLASHLEEIASMYPPEPVERAALRFFEAVARWRGRPELESYKPLHAPSSPSPSMHSISSSSTLAVSSLVSPSSPSSASTSRTKCTTDSYFILPGQRNYPRYRRNHQQPEEHKQQAEGKGKSRWWSRAGGGGTSASVGSGGKRSRRGSWDDSVSHGKSARVDEDEHGGVVEPGWTGPYGI